MTANTTAGARPSAALSAPGSGGTCNHSGPSPVNGQRPDQVNQRFTSNRRRDPRKTTIEHQTGFLVLMVQKFAQRAAAEDPGYGLRALLKIQAVIDQAVAETGRAVVERDGESAVAADLSIATGTTWTKQRVYSRWVAPFRGRESA